MKKNAMPIHLLAKIFSLSLFSCFISVVFGQQVAAAPATPPQLQSWVPWVMEAHPELQCAIIGEERICDWPGRVRIKVGKSGGEFSISVVSDRKQVIGLPGDRRIAPLDVKVIGGNTPPMRWNGNQYELELERGAVEITGRFRWEELPKVLPLPSRSGLVSLEVNGRGIEFPRLSNDGQLWLEEDRTATKDDVDTLQLDIQRKLSDGVPFHVTNRFSIRVSGKVREVSLGKVFLNGSTLVRADAPLPFRLSSDNELTLQVRPGEYVLNFETLFVIPPKQLKPSPGEFTTQETWAWAASEELRSVALSGATQIDPNRTQLPNEWKSLPAFVLEPETELSFEELRRGEKAALPNLLEVTRTFYLDLDGEGFSVRDRIAGSMNQGWRVNAQQAMELGRVSQEGQDLLITQEPQTKQRGVEIRNQQVQLEAESKASTSGAIPAIGWDFDATKLSAELNLPPGWTLFDVSGADYAAGSWVSGWSLMDLFLVLLVSIAFAKLVGMKWGIVALVYLILTHQDPKAPRFIFIHLLASLALIRGLSESSLRRFVGFYFKATLVLLGILVFAYVVDELRTAFYPQLLLELGYDPTDFLRGLIEDSFLGWFFFLLFGWSLFALFFQQRFKLGILLLLLSTFGSAFWFSTSSFIAQMGGGHMDAQFAESGGAKFQQLTRSLDSSESYMAQAPNSEAYSGMRDAVSSLAKYDARKNMLQVDPNALVQTGPGFPQWHWRKWNLEWSGMVSKDATMKIQMIGPTGNFILGILRVIAICGLSWTFFAVSGFRFAKIPLRSIALLLIVGSLPFVRVASAEDFPPSELLKQLEERYLAERCTENCFINSELQVRASGQELVLNADVSATEDAGWTVPGPLDQFLVEQVLIDGAAATALRRDERGFLQIRVVQGNHRIEIRGKLKQQNSVSLQIQSQPGHVEFESSDWDIEGLGPTGLLEGSIQLARRLKAGQDVAQAVSAEVTLPEWYLVTRQLSLGLPWEVTTTVQRLGGTERPATARVPVVFDRNVTSDAVRIDGNFAIVSFARGVPAVSWKSILDEQPTLEMTAAQVSMMNEILELECSPVWRCSVDGLAPVSSLSNGAQRYIWRPYPGEKISIAVSRPEGAAGQTVTVDNVNSRFVPGKSYLQGTLTASIRASRGGFEQIELPAGAVLQSGTIDGQSGTIRSDSNRVSVPLHPGAQTVSLAYQMPWEEGIIGKMPAVKLESPVANIHTVVEVPYKRWILFLNGPAWGPAVLFWSKLAAVLLLAFVLGSSRQFPLGVGGWIFFGLGLATLSPIMIAIPIFWFAAFRIRQTFQFESRWQFNWFQIGLIVLTMFNFVVLYQAVYNGLIVRPDMNIRGNQSTEMLLNWYLDSSSGALPQPVMISLPLWVWHTFMLVWSSWMVFTLLRCLKWAFAAFTEGGAWRSKEEATAPAQSTAS